MATKPTKSRILSDKHRRLAKYKRYRAKTDIKYNNWLMWTVGASTIILATEHAKRETRKHWLTFYNEKLSSKQLSLVSVLRYYMVTHEVEVFRPSEVIPWGIALGILPKSCRDTKFYRHNFYKPLFDYHYINSIPGTYNYSLTMRAKMLMSVYHTKLHDYIQASQRNFLHSSPPGQAAEV